MKQFIISEKQLNEFVEKQISNKVFYEIVEKLAQNKINLNENISLKKTNQTLIEIYQNKKLITPRVKQMLINSKIINENNEIV